MQMENNDKKTINKNVLFTVVYYNVLEFPLTTFEVWRYLIDFRHRRRKVEMEEVIESLDFLKKQGLIQSEKSFWIVNKKEYLADERIAKQKISVSKINRMIRWVRIISKLPYIRAVFITGALAMKRASKSSDWDVIIVTKKNRIWLGRLIITLVLQVFGKRRHHNKIKDRFCLNHFLTESSLILEENNEFSSNEVVFAIPLYGKKNYQKFQQLNEFQISAIRPNYQKDTIENNFTIKENDFCEGFKNGIEDFLEFSRIGYLANEMTKRFMIRKIKKNPKTYISGSDIRYDDGALIFLPVPKRKEILQKTLEEFNSLTGRV